MPSVPLPRKVGGHDPPSFYGSAAPAGSGGEGEKKKKRKGEGGRKGRKERGKEGEGGEGMYPQTSRPNSAHDH